MNTFPEVGQISTSTLGRIFQVYVISVHTHKKSASINGQAEQGVFIAECRNAENITDTQDTRDYTSAEWVERGFIKIETKAELTKKSCGHMMDSINTSYKLGVSFAARLIRIYGPNIWLSRSFVSEIDTPDYDLLKTTFGRVSEVMRTAYLHGVTRTINLADEETAST